MNEGHIFCYPFSTFSTVFSWSLPASYLLETDYAIISFLKIFSFEHKTEKQKNKSDYCNRSVIFSNLSMSFCNVLICLLNLCIVGKHSSQFHLEKYALINCLSSFRLYICNLLLCIRSSMSLRSRFFIVIFQKI